MCLLLFSLLFSGCSYHDSQFSYFNMLDTEKRTLRNKIAAEKFWSSVRPVSTLSASYYKLGRYYQQQGKYDKAIAEFSKALRNDGRYCKAYNGIAMSYDALKRCEIAHDSYEEAIQCDPKGAYLYNNYACSSLLCGDYEKGLALLLEAEQLSEDNSRIKNNLMLAQAIVEREYNLSKTVSNSEAVVLDAQTGLESAENKNKNELADPHYEIPGNSTPMEIHSMVMIDRDPVGHAEMSLLNMSGLVGQQPTIALAAKEVLDLSTEDVSVADKETGSEFVSTLEKNIAIISHIAEKSNKIIVLTQTRPLHNQTNSAVEVSNGNGVTGMAGRSAEYFRAYGFNIRRITNAKNFRFNDSVIFYREGYLQVAKELARVIPGAQNLEKVDSLGRASIGVRVLLGKDLVNVRFPEGYTQNLVDYSRLKKENLITMTKTF